MTDCKTIGLCPTGQAWTNFSKNPHLHIKSIYEGGCLTDDISKPLALILSSTLDNNGGLALTEKKEQGIFATLAKDHTVCHRPILDSSEASAHIEQLGRQKKIDVLLMRAHGSTHLQAYAKEVISSYSPRNVLAAAFRSSLTAFVTIILHSCSNAVNCGVDDFAGFIRSIAPPLAIVYAATRSNEWIEMQSGTPPKVKMFNGQMDITYRSGADGYCNNPVDSTLAQKMKLNSLLYLVGIGQGIDAAINAASEAFKSMDLSITDKAIDLFEKLIEKGQGFEAVINAASEAFKSTDSRVRDKAIVLFKILINKGKILIAEGEGFACAIRAASVGLKSTDSSICEWAVRLFGQLFDKGEGFEAAINAASEAFKGKDLSTHYRAMRLFEKLFEKGKGFEAAINVASEGFKSTDIWIRINAIDLFGKLVERGKGIDAAISVASEALQSTDPRTRDGAVKLVEKLSDKGIKIQAL